MKSLTNIDPKENEWKIVFCFVFFHIIGAIVVVSVFNTLVMFSIGKGDLVLPIYKSIVPITFVLAIVYSFYVGRKIQSIINS